MSRRRHHIKVLIISFVCMRNIFHIFILFLLVSCQAGLENSVPDESKPHLPDTSLGFSKIKIIQEVKNGFLHEYKRFYFQNETIAMQGGFINLVKENWWEEFYVTGKIKSKGNYLQGKKQGDWIMYFESGTLQSHGPFDGGKKNGWWKYYNEKSQMISEGNYTDNKKQGYWITYQNGKILNEGKYEKGEPAGLWKYYKQDEKLESTFDFE